VRAIRDQMASALDLIVQMSRLRDGTRRVTRVTEITGLEGDGIALQDVFRLEARSGADARGRVRGSLAPCGAPPALADRLDEAGVTLPSEVFGATTRGSSRSAKR
jgi:pilus assembly protein CpaF